MVVGQWLGKILKRKPQLSNKQDVEVFLSTEDGT